MYKEFIGAPICKYYTCESAESGKVVGIFILLNVRQVKVKQAIEKRPGTRGVFLKPDVRLRVSEKNNALTQCGQGGGITN